ncbi:TPA: hypothetical protein ACN33Q_004658, partial [Vibrio parahaemolyticus]
ATKDGVTSAPATINVKPSLIGIRIGNSDPIETAPNRKVTITVYAIYSDDSEENVSLESVIETTFSEGVAFVTDNVVNTVSTDTSLSLQSGVISAYYGGFTDSISATIDYRITLSQATSLCSKLGMRVPLEAELIDIFNTQTSGVSGNTDMCTIYGWPLAEACGGVMSYYYTSERDSRDVIIRVNMYTGVSTADDGSGFGDQATAYYHCVP